MNEVIPELLDGERLDRVVAMLGDLSRSAATALIEAGDVRIDEAVITSRSYRVSTGSTIAFDVVESPPSTVPEADPSVELDIVYDDDDVIVINKAAGLVVHPGAGNAAGTVVNGLLARYPEIATVGAADRPGIVHRLDVGTSGLMLVARSPVAYDVMVGQLRDREVTRHYRALVTGTVAADAGVIDAPIGRDRHERTRMAIVDDGREAVTNYPVVERFDEPLPATLLDCRLLTGRTHQIRVHCAAIGHPVLGDARYGGSGRALEPDRPFLHAHELAFRHPTTGRELGFSTPLPADLESILRQYSRRRP